MHGKVHFSDLIDTCNLLNIELKNQWKRLDYDTDIFYVSRVTLELIVFLTV